MPRNAAAYDEDFFAWSEEQAQLLRAGEFSQLDVENIAEELEDMGRSIRRELRKRLAVLTMHLLKWTHQPGHRSPSWSATIREQRAQVAELIEESPSLRPLPARDLAKIYKIAVNKAVGDTGLPEATFPAECPFSPEQLLSEDFLPEG
jgi:Domain of unknown function DUF29